MNDAPPPSLLARGDGISPAGHPAPAAPGPGPVLILASASPRRRLLLGEMGVPFRVEPADVAEWEESAADPEALVRHNAELKAGEVARRFPRDPVLAADTTVALDGHVLNKPADLAEARTMLRRLSGRTHTVFTGLCLRWVARDHTDLRCVTSRVSFRELGEADIDRYFTLVNPLDKAGAYGIQEGRELIIAGWEGSLSNIMGLPVETVGPMLRNVGLAAL